MLTTQDLEFLGRLSLFAGLREPVLSQIGQEAQHLDVRDDQLLFREGENAKEMVIVLDGTLDIVKESDSGVEVCIATLGAGDVAGEMSLFDIQPRSANVWVRAPASLVVIGHSALSKLYREDTQSYALLVLNIAREISIRLRRLDSTLANIMGQIQAVTRTSYNERMPTDNQ